MKHILKQNKGITLTSVVVTVMILIVLSTMIAIRASESITTNKLNNMYNDIKILHDRILIYYSETNAIPKGNSFDVSSLDEDFLAQKNQLDNDVYYEIDLSKIDNVTLSFGNKKKDDTDVYIVNEKTLSVYYAKGITLNGKTYYTIPDEGVENTEITINPLEDKKNRLTIQEELGIANAPDLKQGMTPVVYLDSQSKQQKVEDTVNDYWYDYSNEVQKFANMKLNDGSVYVWIPRFAIDSNGNIKFVDENNQYYDNTGIPSGYSVPSAFDYNGTALSGIWIAKYEASGEKEKVVTILNEDKTSEAERWGRTLLDSEKIDKTSNIALIEANGLNKDEVRSELVNDNDKTVISNFIAKYNGETVSNNKYAICSGSSSSNLEDVATIIFRPKIISVPSNYNTTNENVAYETSEGVQIPKGFYYLMGSKETGLVITADYKGREGSDNEFVWIPVEYDTEEEFYKNFTLYDWENWSGSDDDDIINHSYNNTNGIYADYRTEAGANGDLEYWTDESMAMYSSVKNYKGFYIGRYELVLDNKDKVYNGSSLQTFYDYAIPKSMSTNNFSTDGLADEDKNTRAIVWTIPFYVSDNSSTDENEEGFPAVDMARSMYPNMKLVNSNQMNSIINSQVNKEKYITDSYIGKIGNDTGAISTLVYGVQWDATMIFLKDVVNSTEEGNGEKFIKNSLGMGKYSLSDAEMSNPNLFLKTSEYSVKNIYDLAGNLAEWTMEIGSYEPIYTTRMMLRGGASSGGIMGIPGDNASNKTAIGVENGYYGACARAALYIKE